MKGPADAWADGKEHGTESREQAEVSLAPGEKSEHRGTQPLRYLAIRIRPLQGDLSADGGRVKHIVLVTNIWKWKAVRLIEWHLKTAGTIAEVHDVLKNELAAGVMPLKCGVAAADSAYVQL